MRMPKNIKAKKTGVAISESQLPGTEGPPSMVKETAKTAASVIRQIQQPCFQLCLPTKPPRKPYGPKTAMVPRQWARAELIMILVTSQVGGKDVGLTYRDSIQA